jgi:hypothetical protein
MQLRNRSNLSLGFDYTLLQRARYGKNI